MARVIRIIRGGPSKNVIDTVAAAKARLRRDDVRALAFVIVETNGKITTGYAGEDDGHFNAMQLGVEVLKSRLNGAF